MDGAPCPSPSGFSIFSGGCAFRLSELLSDLFSLLSVFSDPFSVLSESVLSSELCALEESPGAPALSGFSLCFMVPTFMVMLSSLTAVTSPYTSAVSASLTLLSEFSVAPVTLCDSCMVLLSDVFVLEHPTSVVIPRVMPSKIAIYFFFI